MLAQVVLRLSLAIKAMCTIAVKLKFDCFRVQTHKGGDEVYLSTRRLERVPSFLPDVIEVKSLEGSVVSRRWPRRCPCSCTSSTSCNRIAGGS
jgi:ATP-dependent DNA ligase